MSVSIKEKSLKIKGLLGNEVFYTLGILCVVAALSFYAGRMSATVQSEKIPPIPVVMAEKMPKSNDSLPHSSTTVETKTITAEQSGATATIGKYVGSKKGNKFHLPWCSGAKTMSEENKVWFQTKEEAIAAGYTPAANCKGI